MVRIAKPEGILKPALFVVSIFLAVLAGGLSTSVVRASISDSTGVINACYRTKGGDLRVLDAATGNCAKNETPINWQQGGSQVILNQISVPLGSTSTAVVINVPSLGDVRVEACYEGGAKVNFFDSTSHDVIVENSLLSPNTEGAPELSTYAPPVLVTYNDGATTDTATIKTTAFWDSEHSMCVVQAQAIYDHS